MEIPTMAGSEIRGVTSTGFGHSASVCGVSKSLVNAISRPATRTAAGTARSRRIRATTSHVPNMARPSNGNSTIASNGARHRGRSTPASIALASGTGIEVTIFPSCFQHPARTMRVAVTRKAPTTTGNPPSGADSVARNAAPGVDQAALMGILVRRLRKMPQAPMATAAAMSPDAASSAEAPTAVSPWTTMANDPAKPTNAASTPAANAEREIGAPMGQSPIL